MSEDHTKSVTVKRTAKKKSGYTVSQEDGEYFVAEAPGKARVNVGDKVVGINGIRAEEFVDEGDANDLIESIRIVVVPEAEIEEYEAAKEAEEAEDGQGKKKGKKPEDGKKGKNIPAETALAVVPNDDGKNIHHCIHCKHDNEDLSEDEDGDLVCESCGKVIEGEDEGVVHKCKNCGHDNKDLEPDEDGDLVCEECGYTIPEEEDALAAVDNENDKYAYACPDCAHVTMNPPLDDEGDRMCEECGCILPEKVICTCDACGKENVDPEPNEDGEYFCECGEVLNVEEEEPELSGADKLKAMNDEAQGDTDADGQQFGKDGKPTTNAAGKKLTPADMFQPGDVITVTVGKSNPRQDAGLKVEERNGKYYVRKVPSGGLFAKTPVIATDKILELNGTDCHDFKNINELKKILKDEEKITIVVLRLDPDASESEASSVDYDGLAPVTEDGVQREEIEEKDDDTVGYDGHDCGCTWCPDCRGDGDGSTALTVY